jgi:uncharacterized iron-regulated membrane protein
MRTGIENPPKPRLTLRKAMGWLHLWLGLASGFIVFIIALTGCIYVFEKEIQVIVYADRLFVEPQATERKPLSELWTLAQQTLGNTYTVQRAQISRDPSGSYVFKASKFNPKAWTYFGERVYNFSVFVNPYDGKILKIENSKFEFFNLIVMLHQHLLLSNKIGQPIVGTAVIVFVMMLATGLVLWWPRNWVALKARLRIAWSAKWKRLNWDLHSVGGFYAMSLALIIALTGLTWAWDWFDHSVYFIASGGKSPAKRERLVSDTSLVVPVKPIDKILAFAVQQMPQYQEIALSIPDNKMGVIRAFVRPDGQTHYSSLRLQFDQNSGTLLKSESFAKMNGGEKMKALNYDIHVGAILGLPGKIAAFLAGILSATLPISGLLIWLGKRKK